MKDTLELQEILSILLLTYQLHDTTKRVDDDLNFNLCAMPTTCYVVVILARKKSGEEYEV